VLRIKAKEINTLRIVRLPCLVSAIICLILICPLTGRIECYVRARMHASRDKPDLAARSCFARVTRQTCGPSDV
jgi:hypothetical protein